MSTITHFIGRLSSDPITRETGAGDKVTNFLLITNKWIPGRGDRAGRNKTQTHRIVAWGNGLASILGTTIKKGDLVSFMAEVEYGEYEDREGVRRESFEFVIPANGNIDRLAQSPKNRPSGGQHSEHDED